jgi:hypothetical protein
VLVPLAVELRGLPPQPGDELLQPRIVDVLGHGRAQRAGRAGHAVGPVGQPGLPGRVRVAQQGGVAVGERDRLDVEEPLVGPVVREDVGAGVVHGGRERVQLVHHRDDAVGDGAALQVGGRLRHPGEGEQVPALVPVEPQGAGDGREHLLGRADVAPLLEPRVPGDPDAGELRDLLPAQAGGASPARERQPHLLRGDPLAAAAQERRQLPAPHGVGGRREIDDGGHHLTLARRAACYQVVSIPG